MLFWICSCANAFTHACLLEDASPVKCCQHSSCWNWDPELINLSSPKILHRPWAACNSERTPRKRQGCHVLGFMCKPQSQYDRHSREDVWGGHGADGGRLGQGVGGKRAHLLVESHPLKRKMSSVRKTSFAPGERTCL